MIAVFASVFAVRRITIRRTIIVAHMHIRYICIVGVSLIIGLIHIYDSRNSLIIGLMCISRIRVIIRSTIRMIILLVVVVMLVLSLFWFLRITISLSISQLMSMGMTLILRLVFDNNNHISLIISMCMNMDESYYHYD